MDRSFPTQPVKAIFTLMRIIVGWHFLYEGFSKLMIPDWSSYSYLMESKWFLSGFFHWIIAHPAADCGYFKYLGADRYWSSVIPGFIHKTGKHFSHWIATPVLCS